MKIASVYFRGKPPPRYIPATRVFRYPLYGGAAPVTPPNFCPAVFLCLKGYSCILANMEKTLIRKMPIGIQDFEDLRVNNYPGLISRQG